MSRTLNALLFALLALLAGCGGGSGGQPGGGGGGGGGGEGHPFTGNFVAFGTGFVRTMNLTGNGEWTQQIPLSSSYAAPSMVPSSNDLYVARLNLADPMFINKYDVPGFARGPNLLWPETDDLQRVHRFAVAPGGRYMAATMDGRWVGAFLEVLDAQTGEIIATLPNFWVETNMLWTSDMRLVLAVEDPDNLPPGVHGAIVAIPLAQFEDPGGTGEGVILQAFSEADWATWGPTYLALSADDTQLAYVMEGDIWVKSLVDGADAYQLTTGPTPNLGPAFSPDGSHIAFVGGSRSSRSDTFVVPNDRNGPYFKNLDDSEGSEAYLLDSSSLVDGILAWLP